MSDDDTGSHSEPNDHFNPMEGPALSGRSLSDPKQPPVRPNVPLYWSLYVACVVAYTIITGLGFSLWSTILFDVGPLNFGLGILVMIPAFAHIALSLEKVSTNEVAGKYFYGVPLFRARPGLNFVPRGIMNLERYPADIQEIFLPAKEDKIFWGDEEQDLPPGMSRPIWVPTRPPTDAEKAPLDAQMVVGIVGYNFWRVVDVFTFHARVTSMQEADSQLRSIWVRVASEDIVKYTASGAITKQGEINANLDDNIRVHTSDWGIQVTSAGLTKINVSHALGAAMRNRAKAPFEAEATIIAGDAEAVVRERLGKADGKALQDREAGPLLGRAAGLTAIAKAVESEGGMAALASETAVRISENANLIVAGVEGGMKDIMGAAPVIQNVLKTTGGANAKTS